MNHGGHRGHGDVTNRRRARRDSRTGILRKKSLQQTDYFPNLGLTFHSDPLFFKVILTCKELDWRLLPALYDMVSVQEMVAVSPFTEGLPQESYTIAMALTPEFEKTVFTAFS